MSVVRQERSLFAWLVAGVGATAMAMRRAYRRAAYVLDRNCDPVWEQRARVVAAAVVLVIAALIVVGAFVSVYYFGGLAGS
jgi:hypothetical protein